jgi:hypothetical protein
LGNFALEQQTRFLKEIHDEMSFALGVCTSTLGKHKVLPAKLAAAVSSADIDP